MREQPKVISLEQYRRRRYAQDMQRERAIFLAGILFEKQSLNHQKQICSEVKQIEPTQMD
ncbi:hypothetical protein M3591_14895 [Exiguobacterium sp. MER 193]|uniref:hypothetical protein n=1 Tax=Exiguobacterium sp. MER 193 TaxID=2939564 RepID=UPI00204219D3|nr:hypothetical protein [Exiguobacterium sp. MER 193]MCM3281778.1 hypothetical protein [Exiguobacterium sp. MER 193]